MPEDLDEQEEEYLHRELEALSRTYGGEIACNSTPNFRMKFLKGKWTWKHTGRFCDAVQAYASGQTSQFFCQQYHVKASRRWNLSKYEGELNCITLAKAWCSKMQHLLNIWALQPDINSLFSPADVGAWTQPEDFVKLEGLWAGKPQLFEALTEIKDMEPRR